ncbi:MAG TPA: rhomboid family intramembrane serine protease [Thermoanaerobaculia bacterium]|nr:rhomboid family intramembrane serine protease [Thermoanaerobaculia bacterium]
MNTDSEILEIPVVPQRASLASALLGSFGVFAVGGPLLAGVLLREQAADETGWIYFFAALFGLALAIPLFSFHRQTPSPGVLRIEPGHVRWRTSQPGKEIGLAYADLWAAHKQGRGRAENLVFSAREKGVIAVGTAFLPAAQEADSILEAVRRHIALLPDGQQRLDGMAARQAVAERISSGRRSVVLAISVLLGLVFLMELVMGALPDPFLLWAFGANSYPLVRNGELFRLATSNLLHGSLLHLFFNVMVLVNLGSFLTPLLGAGRFLSLLLVSALAGAAGSAFLGHQILSLGASTGIAGLIAAYAVILWRWPDRLSNPPTQLTWLWLGFSFLAPALLFDNVDHMAHLAGFLAGLALVFSETRGTDLLELAGRRRALFRATAALLGVLFLVACGAAIRQARDPERNLKAAAILLRAPSLSPSFGNNLAWEIATNPAASQDQLAAALEALDRVFESEPGTSEYRDTRATLLYRLGRWEEAVQVERGLFDQGGTPFHASQLARFEWALVQTRGPLLLGQPPQVLPRAQLAAGPSILVDRGAPHLLSGAILHFVLTRANTPSALLELQIGTAEGERILRHSLPRDSSPSNPDRVTLTLVDLQTLENRSQETRWRMVPVEPEALRLP